ncbi:unnamed protein product [Phytomonas sp. Hart1]|nr:unnamed protein product [Phytomonas sp. Hart1]|eukprot:CCW66028.1 unnamed protein product [Phytomonas sp. isolate Hart1]
MRYRVGCGYCRWQGFGDFASLQEINAYLNGMASGRTPVMSDWRDAQREANSVIGRAYGLLHGDSDFSSSAITSSSFTTARPVSFSKMAWDKFVDLRRPARSQLLLTRQLPSRDTARRGQTNNSFSPIDDFTKREEEDEKRVFEEVARLNPASRSAVDPADPSASSASSLHPALALDKLRELYLNRAIRRVARAEAAPYAIHNDPSSLEKAYQAYPTYVMEIKSSVRSPSQSYESKEIVNIQDETAIFSDEICWISASQRAQWGLHPTFITATQNLRRLRNIFHDYSTYFKDYSSASNRTTNIAPLRGLINPFTTSFLSSSSSLVNFPKDQADKEPTSDLSPLNVLLQQPENRKFCKKLINYFPKHLSKEAIIATAFCNIQDSVNEELKVSKRADTFKNTDKKEEAEGKERELRSDSNVEFRKDASSPSGAKKSSLTQTLVILDRSEDEDDVKQILEYWQSHRDTSESDLLSSQKLNLSYNIVCANHFSAVQTLPYLQYIYPSPLVNTSNDFNELSTIEHQARNQVMRFRLINLGMQTIVIRRICIARQSVYNNHVGETSSIEFSSRYPQIFHPFNAQSTEFEKNESLEEGDYASIDENVGLVRLLPRCSSSEASVGNFSNYATVELPSEILEKCVDATRELYFDIILNGVKDDPKESNTVVLNSEGQQRNQRYLGLAIDVLTFLDVSFLRNGENTISSKSINGYHAISFGNTIVW